MSEVVGELARVREAFAKPTLRLLSGSGAAFRVAVFRSAFSRDRRSVQADRLHAQVDTYLADLLRVSEDGVPTNVNGRGLCNRWVNDQWLFRDTDPDGTIVYSLTSFALEALDLVQSLARDRVLVSESRLTTILETVRRWALEASPDAEARKTRLEAQIRELQAECDRLDAGGDLFAASDDRMIDGFQDLMDLMGQLPSDFKRVEESVQDMHRQILRDFRDEERPVVDVLDDYLRKQDELVRGTPEGRAFDGAFELLRNDDMLLELRENLAVVLAHPASAVLDHGDVNEIRGAESVIRQGTSDVLAQRRRLSATLKEHVVNHDVLEERELDRVLRGISRELATWMETAGVQAKVPLDLLPVPMKVEHLRERMWDPQTDAPPPPLETVEPDDEPAPTAEELRMKGGPSLDDLRNAILDAHAAGDLDTVGVLFNELPSELRRPVEILGLLHVVARTDALDRAVGTEVFDAIRPNGERRSFNVPTVSLSPVEVAALRGEPLDSDEGTNA